MNGEDDFDDDALSPRELKRLRRILQDDAVARRFKTAIKVYTITVGAIAAGLVALISIWKELVLRLTK